MLAVPVFRDRVAPVLDWCSKIIIIPEEEATPVGSCRQIAVMRENMFKLIQGLREQGIETLICGALSPEMLNYGESLGFTIIHGIAGDIEEVLTAYREGKLDQPKFRLPGCREPRRYKSGKVCATGRKSGGVDREEAARGESGSQAQAAGPGGYCVCIVCGARLRHERGIPCSQVRCFSCDGPMVRE